MVRGAGDNGGVPRWLVWAVVVGATAATWYLWPAIGSGSPDVAAIGGPQLRAAEAELAFQVRDRGRGFEWVATAATWCDVAESLQGATLDRRVGIVVIGAESLGDCDGDPIATVTARADELGVEPVAVLLPGTPEVEGIRAVRTEPLLGPAGTLDMPCQWWDTCPPTGRIEVRGPDGSLTPAGRERVGRMLAAVIA